MLALGPFIVEIVFRITAADVRWPTYRELATGCSVVDALRAFRYMEMSHKRRDILCESNSLRLGCGLFVLYVKARSTQGNCVSFQERAEECCVPDARRWCTLFTRTLF